MSLTMPRASLPARLLFLWLISPSFAWALGLGEIHLHSALNEPMKAEIDLESAAPDELTGLRATLAPREAFIRYGIDKPAFLSSLSFKVGKGEDGHDALLVRSTESIPEPFVTFLVEVNWARGRLMREYTVLLDPPLYSPGESPGSPAAATPRQAPAPAAPAAPAAIAAAAAPAAIAAAAAPTTAAAPAAAHAPAKAVAAPAPSAKAAPVARSVPAAPTVSAAHDPAVVPVSKGDTLTKIARGLEGAAATPADVDQTMIALYRSNRAAFGGNINMLREGTVLRIPGADEIAALNRREAVGEVQRQTNAWKAGEAGAGASAQLRLVAPRAGGGGAGTGGSKSANSGATGADVSALKDRVKDLEAQLAESKRLIDIRNSELGALQRKLGAAAAAAAASPPRASAPVPAQVPPAAAVAPPRPAATPPAPVAPPAASAAKPATPEAAPPPESGTWTDWVAENWWVAPLALLAAVLVGLAVVRRRRKPEADEPLAIDPLGRGALAGAARKGSEAFVVEESGERPAPAAAGAFADSSRSQSPDDTLSNEGPVNLDQGDPLAEADFHMAYGLYDQAAELVRIALEREPERRDLRLKLLEVYFVWGNREAFLQTAKTLEATRDRAPAGEWDKIVIMGRQICPDEPLFAASAGGRGAGAPVDLNLEGGENRVDIDLFGDPEGETRELDHPNPKVVDATAATAQFEGLRAGSEQLDFTLDAPERGADHGLSRAMPARDEPTVESELMNFGDADFIDPPAHDATTAEVRGLASKLPPKADQTAEVSIDDLGLDLDHLDQSETASRAVPTLEDDVQPADAPTRVIAVDEPTRRLLAEADWTAREHGLTDAQRELEASFAAELSDKDDLRTAVLLPLPDSSPTALFKPSDLAGLDDADEHAIDSTSTLRAIRPESIDPDLEQLAAALGNDDTLEQPRAAEDLFSNDVFEPAPRGRKDVDLDTGEPLALDVADSPTNRMTAQTANLTAQTGKLRPLDLAMPELEPVTMSEVGTKLDLARAYMDMGDPEGARSILEEVVEEGSVSQKQEASRLIESLPG